ncbi:MAG: LytTR family DNA-binding domain-containing protein [Reichenbachiella sp.]
MILNCIIIEDEPLAAEKLEGFVEKVPFLKLVGSFRNSLEGLHYLKEHTVDLLFLDIQMDSLTGIELLESLSAKPSVVITTAYQEYAIKGYELHVSDYLLKPYSFTRFLKAANKVQDEVSNRFANTNQSKSIFVKTEYRIEKVMVESILYIEGMSDYLQIHLSDGKKIMCLQKFSAFEETLSTDQLIRIHKSFMISIDKIEAIERLRVKIGERLIPIGNTYKTDFFDLIEKKGLL